jgi:hypothetical protein
LTNREPPHWKNATEISCLKETQSTPSIRNLTVTIWIFQFCVLSHTHFIAWIAGSHIFLTWHQEFQSKMFSQYFFIRCSLKAHGIQYLEQEVMFGSCRVCWYEPVVNLDNIPDSQSWRWHSCCRWRWSGSPHKLALSSSGPGLSSRGYSPPHLEWDRIR